MFRNLSYKLQRRLSHALAILQIIWMYELETKYFPRLFIYGFCFKSNLTLDNTLLKWKTLYEYAFSSRASHSLPLHLTAQTLFTSSSIEKSTYEEHMCVVALTGSERGTQFHPLASYFLLV